MVVSPTRYPIVHHFPIVRTDVVHRYAVGRPIVVAPSTNFRISRTDRTGAFEVVSFQEELLTLVRYGG